MSQNLNLKKCRISGNILVPCVDFGAQPLGNAFLKEEDFSKEYFFDMKAGFCEESKMFQLIDQPDENQMFHENYAFFSGTSVSMAKHFEHFANTVLNSRYFSNSNPFVIELGCNDCVIGENG